MDRRRLLATVGALGLLLGGCVGRPDDIDDAEGTRGTDENAGTGGDEPGSDGATGPAEQFEAE